MFSSNQKDIPHKMFCLNSKDITSGSQPPGRTHPGGLFPLQGAWLGNKLKPTASATKLHFNNLASPRAGLEMMG